MKSSPHHFKKSLGQNFLTNPRILERICKYSNLTDQDYILEIGPGEGTLTKYLSTRVKGVTAIEKDKNLIPALQKTFQNTNVEILQDDILKIDLNQFPQIKKIIGNIPYNISSPIIEKLINHHDHLSHAYLTVQLEFAKRLAAEPNCKDYGALSCIIQYYADVKLHFKIKAANFFPKPKVDSAFIGFTFNQPYHFKNTNFLFDLIKTSFGQRRKTLINALSKKYDKNSLINIFSELSWNEKRRGENLKLEEFIALAEKLI